MNYEWNIKENLQEIYNGIYKLVEIKIVNIDNKFSLRALWPILKVSDGINTVEGFKVIISGNQKEIIAFFAVDAFIGFPTNSNIIWGYNDDILGVIENVNVNNISPLPPFLESIPHEIADNNWLNSLQNNIKN